MKKYLKTIALSAATALCFGAAATAQDASGATPIDRIAANVYPCEPVQACSPVETYSPTETPPDCLGNCEVICEIPAPQSWTFHYERGAGGERETASRFKSGCFLKRNRSSGAMRFARSTRIETTRTQVVERGAYRGIGCRAFQ